jgi:hypothetical protein
MAGVRFLIPFGLVAQSVEHRTFNPLVEGSIPSQPTILFDSPGVSAAPCLVLATGSDYCPMQRRESAVISIVIIADISISYRD